MDRRPPLTLPLLPELRLLNMSTTSSSSNITPATAKGGRRAGAGRKPLPAGLKKVPYATKLPQWLKDWLTSGDREKSGAVLIEQALRAQHGLVPPGVAAATSSR